MAAQCFVPVRCFHTVTDHAGPAGGWPGGVKILCENEIAFVTKAGTLVPYPRDGGSGNAKVCCTIDMGEQIHQYYFDVIAQYGGLEREVKLKVVLICGSAVSPRNCLPVTLESRRDGAPTNKASFKAFKPGKWE